MCGLALLPAPRPSVPVGFVTLKFQADEHPPLAHLPHPVGPPASSALSSAYQKPCIVL